MTATASERLLDVTVDVRFTAAGTPLAVRYDGRIWPVAAEPVHWFARADWWNTTRRAPVGAGNLVDTEHWQVQVRINSASPLRTVEIRRLPAASQWLLSSVDDAT